MRFVGVHSGTQQNQLESLFDIWKKSLVTEINISAKDKDCLLKMNVLSMWLNFHLMRKIRIMHVWLLLDTDS